MKSYKRTFDVNQQLVISLSSKGQRSIVLGFVFICVWVSFSTLMYIILFVNQQEILNIKMDADKQLLESLMGWELTRQVLWAALIIPCLVGIFFTVNRLKEKNSSYNTFLLTPLYLGFIFGFEYCVLKLIWSYQVTKIYEALLGAKFDGTDAFQKFLFISTGAMSSYGIIVISALLGITAALFFLLVQVGAQKKVVPEEEVEPVGKARELIKRKPEVSKVNLESVKGIGPIMAEKLVRVGINSLKDLANSDPQKVAEALNISTDSASVLIDVAGSLIKSQKTSKKVGTE